MKTIKSMTLYSLLIMSILLFFGCSKSNEEEEETENWELVTDITPYLDTHFDEYEIWLFNETTPKGFDKNTDYIIVKSEESYCIYNGYKFPIIYNRGAGVMVDGLNISSEGIPVLLNGYMINSLYSEDRIPCVKIVIYAIETDTHILPEIPFTEYILDETIYRWNNLEFDEVFIVNDQETLKKFIVSADEKERDIPEIDFAKYTLLLTKVSSVYVPSGVAYKFRGFAQEYVWRIRIKINYNPGGFVESAIITDKLPENIEIRLKTIRHN